MKFKVDIGIREAVIDSTHIALYVREWGRRNFGYREHDGRDFTDTMSDEVTFTSGHVHYVTSESAEDLWNELKKNL